MAFPGAKSQVKRSTDKQYHSKHTAWAKHVCPVKASERRSTPSQRRGMPGLSKGRQGRPEVEHAWLPEPDIRLLDADRVILRGSDLEKEANRKLELQEQRRKHAEKACEMQAVQIALRQKHSTRMHQNKKGLSEKDASNLPVLDHTSIDAEVRTSIGYLYSLSEQRGREVEVPERQAKDAFKDGRASSMSGGSRETEAPDDESVMRTSPDLREPTEIDEDETEHDIDA
jgi:hypothetical protein